MKSVQIEIYHHNLADNAIYDMFSVNIWKSFWVSVYEGRPFPEAFTTELWDRNL